MGKPVGNPEMLNAATKTTLSLLTLANGGAHLRTEAGQLGRGHRRGQSRDSKDERGEDDALHGGLDELAVLVAGVRGG